MTPASNPLQALDDYLRVAARDRERGGTFDMDDSADGVALASFLPLSDALTWLGEHVTRPWRIADAVALKQQEVHRYLARVAISAGTLAIIFAICQLALGQSSTTMTAVFSWLGLITALTAGVAVGVGVSVKYNRRWLGLRQRAERLRMLKFRSLGHPMLWSGNLAGWQSWVAGELAGLQGVDQFERIKEWAACDRAEVMDLPAGLAMSDPSIPRGLAIYYEHKRVGFQADYYQRQSEKHRSQVMPLHRHSSGLFIASLSCVILHFAASFLAVRFSTQGDVHVAQVLAKTATWAVALAAILPVLGLGARAWTLALEHARNASLFVAKYGALLEACSHLQADAADMAKTLRHIAHVEHFLEEEHRGWLRLLLEAEWFL